MLFLCTLVLLVSSAFSVYNPKPKKYLPPTKPVLPQRVLDCPGNRRFAPCPLILRINECTSNHQCGLGRCCRDECGTNVCRNSEIIPPPPIFPTTDRCLNEPVGRNCLLTSTRNDCTFNSDCSTNYCCKDACGSRVCRVRGIIPTSHLRECPIVGRPINCAVALFINECDTNADCGSRVCCVNECGARQCRRNNDILPIPTFPPTVRKCPRVGHRQTDNCRFVQDECYNNEDCVGREICCRNTCGRNICRRQLISLPKPGQCPAFRLNRRCRTRSRRVCVNDQDCQGNYKCCSLRCGRQCVRPRFGSIGRRYRDD